MPSLARVIEATLAGAIKPPSVILPSQIGLQTDRTTIGALKIDHACTTSIEMKARLLDKAATLAPAGHCDTDTCRADRDFRESLLHLAMTLGHMKRAVERHLAGQQL